MRQAEIKSLLVVCWLTELITNGPDVYPKHVIDAMMLIDRINHNWPPDFRRIVLKVLEETT